MKIPNMNKEKTISIMFTILITSIILSKEKRYRK